MSESILTSVKKLLGVAEECTDFDPDIVMYLNSVFLVLTQMGSSSREPGRRGDSFCRTR